MASKRDRKNHFIDRNVQGALLVRAARYWVLSLFVAAALTMLGWMFISPGVTTLVELRDYLPALVCGLFMAMLGSLLVLPVALSDLVRMTNRFAGPMFRLRRCMQQAAAGEPVTPIHFRDGDFWQENGDAFNDLLQRLEEQQRTIVGLQSQLNGEPSGEVELVQN